jgi:hypothetical protein
MEKPLATRTLIAVTTEASRIVFVVVIDFRSLIVASPCSFPGRSIRTDRFIIADWGAAVKRY